MSSPASTATPAWTPAATSLTSPALLKRSEHLEAFRYANEALQHEKKGFYNDAITLYNKSGQMLISIAEKNKSVDPMSPLLSEKGKRLIERANEIKAWMSQSVEKGRNALDKLVQWGTGMINTGDMPTIAVSPELEPLPPTKATPVKASIIKNLGGSSAIVSINDEEEFTHMRYTPVTTKNPSNFDTEGNKLLCMERSRCVDILIVITMYNENAEELNMTLRKICKNVEYMTRNSLPGLDGKDAWKRVAACIVSDGRQKANPNTLKYAKEIGIFDAEIMTISSLGSDVSLHLFEYSIQLLNARKNEATNMRFPPIQTIFALKEKNAGKLNSHAWFFNAFAEQLRPKYTVLLDVGTMPTESAIFRLLRTMERDPQIAGCCGEITVHEPNYFNFPVAAQQFEYKISNILDKSLESLFGYISVLPGAFSAYRYTAIRGEPLNAYFLSLSLSASDMGAFRVRYKNQTSF